MSSIKDPARKVLPLVLLLAAGLAGCASTQTKQPAAPAAAPAAAAPQPVANFAPALRCMDTLLLDYGARDITVIVDDLADPTRGANGITKDSLISAVSGMTQRSRAIRVVAAAVRRDQFSVAPQYTLRGTVNLLDNQNVARNGVNTPASVLGVDLTLLMTQDMSVVPGAATRNSVALFKGRNQAEIRKFGVTYGVTGTSGDVVALSSRALVELASIELFGRLARVPYWTCLGLTEAHEGVSSEIQDWYDAMAVQPAEIIKYFQTQLRARRVYEGPIDGVVNAQLKDAVGRYREALGLAREPKLSLDFFKAYLAADHHQVEAKVTPATPTAIPVPAQPAPVPGSSAPILAFAPPAPAPAAAPAPAVAPAPAAVAPGAIARTQLALHIGTANDTRRFAPGEKVNLTIRPSRSAHVYCFLQDEERKIKRFFPNRFQRDSRVQPAEGLQLPGKMGFELAMNTSGRQETVSCFATERDVLAALPPSIGASDFDTLPVASLGELRNVFTRAANGALAYESFQFQPK